MAFITTPQPSTELLERIIRYILTDYLDVVMPDRTFILEFALQGPLPIIHGWGQLKEIIAAQIEASAASQFSGPFDGNPFPHLLSMSRRVRQVTLRVLSKVLYIPQVAGGR